MTTDTNANTERAARLAEINGRMQAFIKHGEPFKLRSIKVEDGEPAKAEFVYDNNKALMGFLVDMVVEKGVDDIILGSIPSSEFHSLRSVASVIILAGVQDKNFTNPSDA